MKEPLRGCQCELDTCWWKNHCMAVNVSFTHVDERTIAWLSLWASHMLMKEPLHGRQCELDTCWWRKCCVAINVNTAHVDERNTVWLWLWALRTWIKETLRGWNFKTRCVKCKKRQDMGKTFRILVQYKMEYSEKPVHTLNYCM